jgi:solute carrier family 25 (adenine nucleotide translocator) protein 4/5/6/31
VRGAATLYATPVDRLRILLQTNYELVRQNRLDSPYKSAVDGFKRTYKNEGFMSFYRGNTVQLLRAGISPVMSFALKDTFRQMFKPNRATDGYGLWFTKNIVSGAMAGATALIFVYPLDLGFVKRTTDVLSPSTGMTRKHKGVLSIWKDVVKNDGVTGLYRGLGLSVAGIALYRGLYFGLYDGLKPLVINNPNNFVASFALGWGVTMTAGFATYPITLMRNRLMVTTGGGLTYKHSLHLAREIMAKEGLRGFFRGFIFSTTMSIAGAGMLAGYDMLKNSQAKQH